MHSFFRVMAIVWLVVGLTGCGQNPATMGKAEVEAHLKEVLSLKSVSMDAKSGGGGFTGTGEANDGVNYTIDVVQDPQASQLSYTAKSKDGDDIRTGSLKNK